MAPTQKQKLVNFRASERDYDIMKKFADFNGQSLSEMITCSVMERIEDWQDLKTYAKYKKRKSEGKEPSYTHEEILKEFGLSDEL
jgi:hypothetical protein